MKKLLCLLLLLIITASATAATATLRKGDLVNQYAISDPGNASGFDNIRIIESHRIPEVLIQFAGNDFHTRKANWLCWGDPDVLECPDDDIGGGVMREPELVFLNDIMTAGGVTLGAPLSDLRTKEIYLGFWYEYRTKKVFNDAIAEMVLEGMNATQQKRALRYIMFGNGIDMITSQTLSTNWIDSSVEPVYTDLGLATIPLQDRRLLKIFGEVGWFE